MRISTMLCVTVSNYEGLIDDRPPGEEDPEEDV